MKKFELSEEELACLVDVLDDHCFETLDSYARELYFKLRDILVELRAENEEES
jgi:hypothetical protein